MKIIHFVVDDKFIDGAISLFEADDRVENKYLIIQKKYQDFNYLKNANVERIKKNEILKKVAGCDAVVLHSLSVIPIYIIARIPKPIKVIWYAWGHDLYEGLFKSIIPTNLFEVETEKYLKAHPPISSLKKKTKYLYKTIMHKLFLESALARIDFFSGVFPYECDEIKKYHSCFTAKPLDYYYGSSKFFIPENFDTVVKHGKKNVIIGNSGNATNNHLDVLQKLRQEKCSIEGQIIIPLSYGCDDEYANTVYAAANEIYPNQINALREYMPLNDYLNLTSNCRVAIYAHNRQQASDNIFLQLQYGAKVYMPEKSLAYHYLKSIGLKLFSLENDLGSFNEDIDDKDVLENRRILSSLYSSSKLIERIKKINDELCEVKK